MQYQKSRETFTSALHILCGDGSFYSRLERVSAVLSELHPVRELPNLVLCDYYQLKLYIERTLSPAASDYSAEYRNPNRQQQALVIERFVNLFKQLVENVHEEHIALLLKQIEQLQFNEKTET
ncbi:hypothetical protein OAG1_42090 [Agarivorans sp. OAG1]|uniref:hypothetical protein n=1 Tax=Agarivorans sp. OAG1 TaxID=3082387 RepID=UPI002B2C254B|nr:hypothetical protein OAG1_42090 [Agarivorans sp. OAG1]